MVWKKKTISTRQEWLDRLGKLLVWYFPEAQAREVLSDFREQFETGRDRGRTETDLIGSMGTPEEVLCQLLEEEPTAKMARLRTSGLWGAALALCFALLWVSFSMGSHLLLWVGSCGFIAAAGAVLFLLLRGPARVGLERDFPPERQVSPVPGYCIPFVLTLLFEVIEQLLFVLAQAGRLPEFIGEAAIGDINTWFIIAIEAVLALLAVWLLVRSVTVSVRYFPGLIHTAGTGGTVFFTYVYLHFTIVTGELNPSVDLLFRLLPWLTGLAVARAFQKWVDGRSALPLLFRAKAVNRQDWLHRLGVSLLRWFSAGQALEILEDYQEQFELGQERGRSEENLIADLGRPETVVRDLLAEDRKARARRRVIWPWAVMLAAAGLLMLGLLGTYERGAHLMLFYFYPVQISIAALVLGTAALLVLLQAGSRAAVEARFPARRTPTVRLFLAPALICALTAGFGLYLIQLAFHGSTDMMFWGRPVPWYLADIIDCSTLALLFLLVWTLARCFSGSIRYLPAAIHATGSMASILRTGIFFHAMNAEFGSAEETLWNFLPSLLPWLTGAVLALAVWLVIRFAGKPRKEG